MSARRGAICVLAKVPRLGRVKTRLARAVGDARALALAEAFLEDTVAALAGLAESTILAFDDDPPERWRHAPVRLWQQGGGDLGDRLERVLGRALEEHAWAIAVGADSPGLPIEHLRRAIESLDRHDGPRAVIGPCRDGGYYLVGVRAMAPGTLANVRWSTPHALDDTERALARAGSEAARLDPWFDVDEKDDLEHLDALLAAGVIVAPATSRVLRGPS